MKILHTADWHLNHRLGRVDMTEMLQSAVVQIADLLETHRVDVLLIAGDLYSGREGREQLKSSMRFLKQTFSPFLQRGGTMIAISGNHDSEAFFETLRDAFDMVAPVQCDKQNCHLPGRFYIAPNPRVLTLKDTHGTAVQFVLMPYPTPRNYLPETVAKYKNVEERNASMAQIYREMLEKMIVERVDETLPAVLVSHAQVRGVSPNELFLASDATDVIVEADDLPLTFAYGAYGHIHRANALTPSAEHFRYCGSLISLDAGEQGQQKGVVLVEVGASGRVGSPQTLMLKVPRLLELTLTPETIETLRDDYPDCGTALLKYHLRYDPDKIADPYSLHSQVREVFPFWYEALNDPQRPPKPPKPPKPRGTGEDGDDLPPPPPPPPLDLSDLRGTTQRYLHENAVWSDTDAPLEDVWAFAETLFADDALMTMLKEKSI